MSGERSSTQRMLRTMLTDAREDGPGAWQASLPVGKHTLSLRISEEAGPSGQAGRSGRVGHVRLRAYPEDVIPERLTRHRFVRQRLANVGDIVATGRLGRDENGRLVVDLELDAEMPRTRLVAVVKRLTLDCARLRGAAEGLHAIAPEGAGREDAGRAEAGRRPDEAAASAEPPSATTVEAAPAPLPAPAKKEDALPLVDSSPAPSSTSTRPPSSTRPASPRREGPAGAARLRPPPSAQAAGGATRMFAVPAELFAENPQVATGGKPHPGAGHEPGEDAADPAQGPQAFEGRNAMLAVATGASSGERFPLGGQESFCIGRSPNVDVTVNDRSVSRRNSLVRWIEDGLWIEDLNSANGTRVNGRLATRVELHPGDSIEVGETTLRVEVPAEGEAPEPAAGPDVDIETSTVKRSSGVVPASDLSLGAVPPKIAARRGISGGTAPVGPGMPTPPPRSGGYARPPKIAPKAPAARGPAPKASPPETGVHARRRSRANEFFDILSPEDGSGVATAPSAPASAPPGERERGPGGARLQNRKNQFDAFLRDDSGAQAPAATRGPKPRRGAAGARKGRRGKDAKAETLFEDGQVEDALSWMEPEDAPEDAASALDWLTEGEAGPPGGGDEPPGAGALDWMGGEEKASRDKASRGAADRDGGADGGAALDRAEALEAFGEGLDSGRSDALSSDGEDGGRASGRRPAEAPAPAGAPAPAEGAAASPVAGAAPADSGRITKQREEALAWMDSVDVSESDAVDSRAVQRRHQFAIPKALLPSLRKIARDWYRHPERTTLSGEIRVEGESLWVQSGFAPGESSWRYRRPTLRLGKPPIHFGSGTYVPESNELSHAEVASWLLSEGLIDEKEVTDRARARSLLEEAWVLRADGQPDEALDRLEQVIELFDDDVLALTSIGHLCRKELEAPERGREYYIRALELAPRFTPALLGRAMLLLDSDRHRAAEAAVQALALAPEDPDALELAGLITLRAGRRARAREIFLRLFRKDRDRGLHALGFIDAERGGTAKWDPRLVMAERRLLEQDDLDSITRALYEERVELAGQLDGFIEAYPTMDTADRVRKLDRLRDARSYSFFADLLELYLPEPAVEVRQAMEDAFLGSPTSAALALEDALSDGVVTDRAVAAAEIAAKLQWRDLIPRVLTLFRRTALPREVALLTQHLVRCSGTDVALALLAKLERGFERCRDALAELLAERPAPAAEEAAAALAEVIGTEDAVELTEDDRVFLEAALEPAGSY